MKKITIPAGIVVLAVAAYTGTSWYVGKRASVLIEQGVANANQHVAKVLGPDLTGMRVSISILDYRRGVFASDARYQVHVDRGSDASEDYIVRDHLQHGPFPLAALKDGVVSPMLAYSQAQLDTPLPGAGPDVPDGSSPVRITTRIDVDGSGQSSWTVAPMALTLEDGSTIQSSGGQIDVAFSKGFIDNEAHGHMASWARTDVDSGETLAVNDISMQSTTKSAEAGQFDHHTVVNAKSLAIDGTELANAIKANDIKVDLSSVQSDALMDAMLRYDIGSVFIDDADTGRLAAGATVKNLDVAALTRLHETYAMVAERHQENPDHDGQITEQDEAEIMAALRAVLAAGPELTLDPLMWENTGGRSGASAFVAMQDPGTDDTDLDVLLPKLVARARLHMDVSRPMVAELFKQVGINDAKPEAAYQLGEVIFDEYAARLTKMGLATLKDGTLTLELDIDPANDAVSLNGQAMSTEQLMLLGLGLLMLQ